MSIPAVLNLSVRGGSASPVSTHSEAGEIAVAVSGTVRDLVRERVFTGDLDLRVSIVNGLVRVDVVPCQNVDARCCPSTPAPSASELLTAAEERVLAYLPTHLTFANVANELSVSRNTVKSHALAIYRKLGARSRHAAVLAARELDLLPAT